jgi:ribosome maturation factor RimP
MNSLQTRILQQLEAVLKDEHHFFVDLKLGSNGRHITVLLDGDEGVSIDYCAEVSRALGERLETFTELDKYVLEVSSPGADAPLRLLRQYPKHIGRTLKLMLNDGNKLEAKLIGINGSVLELEYTQKEKGKKAVLLTKTLQFSEIKEAKVIISFK